MNFDRLTYPRIDITNGGAIPVVRFPREPRERYREQVREFYGQGGKEEVVRYTEDLGSLLNTELRLVWNEELGLTSIGIGHSAGLDLEERRKAYIGHNIYTLEQAVPAFLVATKYISMLL